MREALKNVQRSRNFFQENARREQAEKLGRYQILNEQVIEGSRGKSLFTTRTNENIRRANQAIEALARKMSCTFINVHAGLTDEQGKLKKEYTVEGIHMYANGYRQVLENLVKYL